MAQIAPGLSHRSAGRGAAGQSDVPRPSGLGSGILGLADGRGARGTSGMPNPWQVAASPATRRAGFSSIVAGVPLYRFADFVLSPRQRTLARDGQPIALIPRYFDLLLFLVERRTDAVHRRDIFDRVWSDVIVSDSALSQAIRTLRRTLGDDPREPRFIRTVSRHGYQFVCADLIEDADDGLATARGADRGPRSASSRRHVGATTVMTGGDDDVVLLRQVIPTHRCWRCCWRPRRRSPSRKSSGTPPNGCTRSGRRRPCVDSTACRTRRSRARCCAIPATRCPGLAKCRCWARRRRAAVGVDAGPAARAAGGRACRAAVGGWHPWRRTCRGARWSRRRRVAGTGAREHGADDRRPGAGSCRVRCAGLVAVPGSPAGLSAAEALALSARQAGARCRVGSGRRAGRRHRAGDSRAGRSARCSGSSCRSAASSRAR